MRICPICDKPAISSHHIKSRKDGGTDDPRNILYLCKKCHDEIEGQDITPKTIEDLRRQLKGEETVSQDEYWYSVHQNGTFFMGIKEPGKPLKPIGIFIPYPKRDIL